MLLILTIASVFTHPLIQAILLILCFVAFIFFFIRHPRTRKPYERWRNDMPCYLSVQDKELNIIETNKLFELDFGECVGKKCYKAYKNRIEPCHECPVLQTFIDREVHSSEEKVIKRDGKTVQVVVTSAPLFDSQGRVSSVIELSTDITKIKALENELAQYRRDYKQLFDAVPCYIVVLNRNLEIIETNALYIRDFEDNKGQHCYAACKSRTSPCPDCLVEKTFQDGKVRCNEEKLTTKDGREVDLIVYSMPISNESGEIVSTMEVFTDITEVKNLQSQLTLMGRAVAGTAHRIKNILMGLEGGTFVVNEGMETDDKVAVAQGWEMVERNVHKVSIIVKDLLYCAKERELKIRNDVSPVEIVREVHDLFVERIAKEDIDFLVDLEESIDRGTYDPDGLHNLLSNLVANAIDACRFDPAEMKSKHTITLRCHRRENDGVVIFEVGDDGAGIPEDLQDKVFEDFFSSKGSEGTGVGLLVVQKVAEEHGGKVSFTSEQGKGTTFRVEIHEATRIPDGKYVRQECNETS